MARPPTLSPLPPLKKATTANCKSSPEWLSVRHGATRDLNSDRILWPTPLFSLSPPLLPLTGRQRARLSWVIGGGLGLQQSPWLPRELSDGRLKQERLAAGGSTAAGPATVGSAAAALGTAGSTSPSQSPSWW
uniref:Uncharacterized protein n=1 Tax=Oryza sativa subsp. japonica TaxID=39947 RepID=Q6YW52_ORYSJ|nr:hypothetical protein [Oryza sativa Japonica Group]BAD17608.1 hypothetical protein [Oryza sativa Japonica Group]